MGTSYQETKRHDAIGEPSTRDLDGWEFGPPRGAATGTANALIGPVRTEPATHEHPESDLSGWTFGMANERRDPPTEPVPTLETGSGTVSPLEARLAPIVGFLVVLSLLLGGGYIVAVTIW